MGLAAAPRWLAPVRVAPAALLALAADRRFSAGQDRLLDREGIGGQATPGAHIGCGVVDRKGAPAVRSSMVTQTPFSGSGLGTAQRTLSTETVLSAKTWRMKCTQPSYSGQRVVGSMKSAGSR